MINTNEYEGHPPAPWGWRHKVAEWRLTANGDKEWIDGIRVNEDTDPTVMTLIADAPLLLQEIKRLRKDIEGYKAIWDYLDPKGYAWQEEEFVALLKEHGFETGVD